MVDDKPEDTKRSPDSEPLSASGPAVGADSAKSSRKSRTPPTIDLEASQVEAAAAENLSDPEPVAGASSPDVHEIPGAATDRRRDSSLVGTAVSALIGAAAAVLIGCAAWFSGLLDASHPLDVPTVAMVETLGARLARLEEPPASKPDAASAAKSDTSKSDTSARLDAIEKSTGGSLAALRDDLSAVRAKSDRTASALDDIKSAPQAAAASPDISAMQDQVAQLATKLQALTAENAQLKEMQSQAQSQAAQIKVASADDVRLKRAVAAASLDLAARQGEPFGSTLAAAKQFSDDAAVLKPLEGFVANGVPGAPVLSRELLMLLPQLAAKPDAAPAGTGWFDRLKASAARLIKIKRADTASGSEPAAIVARAAVAARRNDIMEAKRELNTLPQADRAKVQPWIDRVDARDAALSASRQFSANAMTALAKDH